MAMLTVDLDDEATAGLEAINAALDETAEASAVAAKGAAKLTAEQQRQITVINQNTQAVASFGSTSVSVFGKVAVEGVRCFRDIEVASTVAVEHISVSAIKAGAAVAKYAIVTVGAVKSIEAVWGSGSKAAKKHGKDTEDSARESAEAQATYFGMTKREMLLMGASAATVFALEKSGYKQTALAAEAAGEVVSGEWGAMAKAAKVASSTIVKSALEIGPQVLGAKLGLMALDAAMGATGKQTERLSDGTVKVTTNLDRMRKATNEFASDISRDFTEAGQAFAAWWGQPTTYFEKLNKALKSFGIDANAIGKEFDQQVTDRTELAIRNAQSQRAAYNETVIQLRAAFMGWDEAATTTYRNEIANLRELAAWHEKMNAQRSKEAVYFAALKNINQDLESHQKARNEAERIGSIKTTQAIDDEIMALKEKAGAAATACKFTLDAAKEYASTLDSLDQRRRAIIKEDATEADKNHKAALERHKESLKAKEENISAMIEEMHKSLELYNLEQKRLLNREELAAAVHRANTNQEISEELAIAKELLDTEKALAAEKLRAAGGSDSQVKSSDHKLDKQFAEAEHRVKMAMIDDEFKERALKLRAEQAANEKSWADAEEKTKRRIQLKTDEDKLAADLRIKRIEEEGRARTKINQMDLQEARQIEQEKFKLKQEALKYEDDLRKKTIGQGFDPESFMQAADPQKVFKQIQLARAQAEKEKQAEKDADLKQSGDAGNMQDAYKFKKNQEAADKRGRYSAYRDADNGSIGEREVREAQQQVSQDTLATLQKQGTLNAQTAAAMTTAVKTLADQQVALSYLSETMDKVIAFQKGVKSTAQQTVTTTQNQQGGLN